MTKHCHGESYENCIERVPIFSSLSQDEMGEIAAITKAQFIGLGSRGESFMCCTAVRRKFPA